MYNKYLANFEWENNSESFLSIIALAQEIRTGNILSHNFFMNGNVGERLCDKFYIALLIDFSLSQQAQDADLNSGASNKPQYPSNLIDFYSKTKSLILHTDRFHNYIFNLYNYNMPTIIDGEISKHIIARSHMIQHIFLKHGKIQRIFLQITSHEKIKIWETR